MFNHIIDTLTAQFRQRSWRPKVSLQLSTVLLLSNRYFLFQNYIIYINHCNAFWQEYQEKVKTQWILFLLNLCRGLLLIHKQQYFFHCPVLSTQVPEGDCFSTLLFSFLFISYFFNLLDHHEHWIISYLQVHFVTDKGLFFFL